MLKLDYTRVSTTSIIATAIAAFTYFTLCCTKNLSMRFFVHQHSQMTPTICNSTKSQKKSEIQMAALSQLADFF